LNSIALNLNLQHAKREIGCLVLILQQIEQNHSTLTFLGETGLMALNIVVTVTGMARGLDSH
jgi:hypothetical protein